MEVETTQVMRTDKELYLGIAKQALLNRLDDPLVVERGYTHGRFYKTQCLAELPLPFSQKNRKPVGRVGVVIGNPGTGKSRVVRLMAAEIEYAKKHGLNRPIWVFDHGGRDWYHGFRKNREPKNLPPGMRAHAFKAAYYRYISIHEGSPQGEAPVGYEWNGRSWIRNKKKRFAETLLRVDLGRYKFTQLLSLGFTIAETTNLLDIMDEHEVKGVKELHKLILSSGIRRDFKDYLDRDFKAIVLRRLGSWSFNGGDINIEKLLESGQNAVFSFCDDSEMARAQIDLILSRLRLFLDQHPDCQQRPYIIIEESHEIFGRQNDGLGLSLRQFVLKLRKLGVYILLILPSLVDFDVAILKVTRDWVFGVLDEGSMKMILSYTRCQPLGEVSKYMVSDIIGVQIKNDLVCYCQDTGRAYLFDPWECPQEFNRRV